MKLKKSRKSKLLTVKEITLLWILDKLAITLKQVGQQMKTEIDGGYKSLQEFEADIGMLMIKTYFRGVH